jgi:diketogulonate reductase-like aldo/keto reductase
MHLQQDGKISHLGLTNFDSDHMVDLIEQGAPIVSNQVRLQPIGKHVCMHVLTYLCIIIYCNNKVLVAHFLPING